MTKKVIKINKFMLTGGILLIFGETVLLIWMGSFFAAGEEILNPIFLALKDSSGLSITTLILLGLFSVSGVLLICGAFVIPNLSQQNSANKILAEGLSGEAKILFVSDSGTRIERHPLINFSLEVRTPYEPAFKAEVSQIISVAHLPSFQPGKLVKVKYLPDTTEVFIVGAKFS